MLSRPNQRRHFAARAEKAQRDARAVVLGLHVRLGVSGGREVFGLDVRNAVRRSPDFDLSHEGRGGQATVGVCCENASAGVAIPATIERAEAARTVWAHARTSRAGLGIARDADGLSARRSGACSTNVDLSRQRRDGSFPLWLIGVMWTVPTLLSTLETVMFAHHGQSANRLCGGHSSPRRRSGMGSRCCRPRSSRWASGFHFARPVRATPVLAHAFASLLVSVLVAIADASVNAHGATVAIGTGLRSAQSWFLSRSSGDDAGVLRHHRGELRA